MTAPVILIYVEDPGAANMALDVSAALETGGAIPHLFAGGAAESYLRQRGETPAPLPGGMDLASWVDAHSPAVIAVGTSENPDTPAFPLISIARARGIPTVGLIDGPANAEHRFRGRGKEPLTFMPDWLVAADGGTGDAYRALGIDPGRIRVTGNPSLDRVRDNADVLRARGRDALRRECFPELAADAPLILFLTELSDGLETAQFRRGPDYSLAGRGGVDGRTEIVLEEVLDAAKAVAPNAQVALRLHPKTPAHLYNAYKDDIAAFSAGGDAHPPLVAADLVVGLSTALLFEAALMGLPVLSVLPRAEEVRWLLGGDTGVVPVVTDRPGLRDALARALSDPANFMPRTMEGAARFGAAPRIARALTAVAAGQPPAPDGTLPYSAPVLETPRLRLEPFSEAHLNEHYVGWLNDPEVVRFSEQRHQTHTLESCRDFIASFQGTANGLWAIRDKQNDLHHVGNISTEIDAETGTGDIRILIGERAAWGTGIGAEAWMRVMAHLFDDLGLARVTAGTLEGNRGMLKIMEKSGMLETHRRPGPTPVDGRTMDMIYAERRARDWHGTR
jgi:RimJ/RimL family protein N-acetyltransferase